MKTEEAIKCVKDKYESYEGEYCAGTEEVDKCYKEQDEVIALLQCGKKYEEIVKSIKQHIKRLLEEYFPKEEGK